MSGNRTRVPLVTSRVCYHCTITTTLLATEQSVRFTGKPRGSPAFNHSGTGHTSDHPRMIHRLPANYINYLE